MFLPCGFHRIFLFRLDRQRLFTMITVRALALLAVAALVHGQEITSLEPCGVSLFAFVRVSLLSRQHPPPVMSLPRQAEQVALLETIEHVPGPRAEEGCAQAPRNGHSHAGPATSPPSKSAVLTSWQQTCYNDTLAQFARFGCASATDVACMCRNPDFSNAIRDCSSQSCADPNYAGVVVGAANALCASKYLFAALSAAEEGHLVCRLQTELTHILQLPR